VQLALFTSATHGEAGLWRTAVFREDDDPGALGLETGTLPGGRYVRVRLEGEPPAVYGLIAPTFEKLAKRGDRDPARPEIEFYRRRDLIELLLPIVRTRIIEPPKEQAERGAASRRHHARRRRPRTDSRRLGPPAYS
jgi:hypothetical protein